MLGLLRRLQFSTGIYLISLDVQHLVCSEGVALDMHTA